MAYIKSFPDQNYLIPPKLTDLFCKDHVCYLIKQLADGLDYSGFDEKYAGAGHPAYHPRICLKLLLMANIDGMRSSRRIAKNAQENVVYIFLAEKTQPDFRTISDFRKDNPEIVQEAALQLTSLAVDEGLVDLSQLLIDGTMIKADANNNRILDRAAIEKLRKHIRKEIERGIKVDEEEDKIYGDKGYHRLPDDLNTSEKRRPVIRKIADEINKAVKDKKKKRVEEIDAKLASIGEVMDENGLKKYSLTDPDARFILGKKGKVELNYNAQLVVDKRGIILANNVVQDCDDRHQLLPNLKRVEQSFGPPPEEIKVCADGGYMSPDIVQAQKKGYDLYLPTYGMMKHKPDKFDKLNFKYDDEKDCYICPENKVLNFAHNSKDKRYGHIKIYRCKECPTCPHQKPCCKKEKFKRLTALPHEKIVNRIKEKMQTPEGKAIYKKRTQTVETAFGDLKHNKKFRDFMLRGIEKVKIEFGLVCLAHNLVRINNLLGDARPQSC